MIKEQAFESLTGKFLIAMPALADPNFFQSVTFICEHNEEGAMGLMINRETEDVTVGEVITQLGLDWPEQNIADKRAFLGGPMDTDRGFLIHSPVGNWEATIAVDDAVNEPLGITSSLDIMQAIAQGDAPRKMLLVLGYAGWGPGQLERELAQNAWLSGPGSQEILFDTPCEDRRVAAAALLGVDLSLLSSDVGHS